MRDVELIACRLRRVEPLCRLTNSALQQLAMCGFYEDLEKGVTCKSALCSLTVIAIDMMVRPLYLRKCFELENRDGFGMLCLEDNLKFATMQQQKAIQK
jgi:hypothetical protein